MDVKPESTEGLERGIGFQQEEGSPGAAWEGAGRREGGACGDPT